MNKESSQNIIKKLIERYASIRFYQDNGVIIQSEFIDEFCTYFKSPSQLAVEFSNARRNSDHGFSKLLLSDSKLLYKQFPGNVFTEVDSYPSPLNYHFVLGLLLKEIKCSTIESLQSKGDQEYLGHSCFNMVGSIDKSKDIELTICKKDLFVRRVVISDSKENATIEIHYKKVSDSKPPQQVFLV